MFFSHPSSWNRWTWKSERFHLKVEECTATEWEATSKKWENLRQILWVRFHPLFYLPVFTPSLLKFFKFAPHPHPKPQSVSSKCTVFRDLCPRQATANNDLGSKNAYRAANCGLEGMLNSWLTKKIQIPWIFFSLDSLYWYSAFIRILKSNFGPFRVCSL